MLPVKKEHLWVW